MIQSGRTLDTFFSGLQAAASFDGVEAYLAGFAFDETTKLLLIAASKQIKEPGLIRMSANAANTLLKLAEEGHSITGGLASRELLTYTTYLVDILKYKAMLQLKEIAETYQRAWSRNQAHREAIIENLIPWKEANLTPDKMNELNTAIEILSSKSSPNNEKFKALLETLAEFGGATLRYDEYQLLQNSLKLYPILKQRVHDSASIPMMLKFGAGFGGLTLLEGVRKFSETYPVKQK